MFVNFKNILDTFHPDIPFGIAQVGKAFRNEIVVKQFIFRTREFEQMEMQYFLHPNDMDQKFEYWKEERMNWYLRILQIPKEKLRFKKHEKLVHYAKAAYDIQYQFTCLDKYDEVEGIHQRGDWDLSRHGQFSGQKLDYLNPVTKERFIPHIMETSVGLNRLVLMMLDMAYTKEDLGDGKSRVVLKLPTRIAPVKVAIFPLQKNEKLRKLAEDLYINMRGLFVTEFDDAGNIGKMYRRQDEIGTPFCVTIDYQSLEDQTVTVRERDSMKQERIHLDKISAYMKKKLSI